MLACRQEAGWSQTPCPAEGGGRAFPHTGCMCLEKEHAGHLYSAGPSSDLKGEGLPRVWVGVFL